GSRLLFRALVHGDDLHVSYLKPEHPGRELFDIRERFDAAGMHLRDARTGKNLWKKPSGKAGDDDEGPGRGNAFDIDPRYPGAECWVFGAGTQALLSVHGATI